MPKIKRKAGQPAKYQTVNQLQKKIDEYFKTGVNHKKVVVGPPQNRRVELLPIPTICGLVRYCGFVNRGSFYDLEKSPKFSNTIKAARNRIEQDYEEDLKQGLGAGAIFALKNFGWIDEQHLKGDGIANIVIQIITPKEDSSDPGFGISRNRASLAADNPGL